MDYDSIEGIQECLVDLAGLHALAAERHKAGYQRGEHLREFLVLGRFHLDSCGNFMISTFEHDYKIKLDWLPESLPLALPWGRLHEVLTKLVISSTGYRLPAPEALCDECGEGWTLKNVHDAVTHGEGRKEFRHIGCQKLYDEREVFQKFHEVAEQAGLGKMLLTPLPNEYWPEAYQPMEPWCLMRTPKGEIKFGWRKRVISLDWSDLVKRQTKDLWRYEQHEEKDTIEKAFHTDTLFPKEDVTKDAFLIHAWGYQKLVEYLCKIAEVAKLGTFARGGDQCQTSSREGER